LDLEIFEGEFFTFVGPSGCGKSTLLNIIAGLEPVSGGRIYFGETLVNDLSPRERDVAMVFQSYALYPHMTVYENIAFPLRMKRMQTAAVDRDVRSTATLLGLAELLDRRPSELSGGQRQRVALGRAIVRQPRLFLLDEPLSNLDARLRLEMRTELKRLHGQLNITTVYVTHDQSEALSLSDRIAVIRKGRIQQCGTPGEIFSHPSNLFVAEFMGDLPMNFLPATPLRISPLEVDCRGVRMVLPGRLIREAADLVLGIRPEDVRLSFGKTDQAVEANIRFIELAGSRTRIEALWQETPVMGFAERNEALRPGTPVFIAFPADRCHVFDRLTGENLGDPSTDPL
ncbi:MAG: ABC transporter ATP-binding protein, partial [Deltaproteobacteria bacterium]|nr:ABC transporter ATP-binding protein [Deltaproteobacteria bacterium]